MIALKEEEYIITNPFLTKVKAPVKPINSMVLITCNRNLEKLIRKEFNIKKRNQLERILKANSQIIINSL